jgi:alkylhydroperoxidase family enzyme
VKDAIDELRAVLAALPPAPAASARYLEQVRSSAYAITDADVEELKERGLTEDEIFEQTVGVAITEGLRRLDLAERILS